MHAVYKKLHVQSRTEALVTAAVARDNGLEKQNRVAGRFTWHQLQGP